jgi:putative lipoic acid-binding regulatory protein
VCGAGSYTVDMSDDTAGPLLGWSLNSIGDSNASPFDDLNFPCVFRFKAIGKAEPDLVMAVLAHVERLLGAPIAKDAWSVRDSSGGKYASLTLDLTVTSGQQIYDVYEALRKDPRITHLL